MKVTDSFVNGILKDMGVNPNQPPHWIQQYYISKADPPIGGKTPDGYMCSFCGRKSYSKLNKCDACNSIMVEWSGDKK